MIPPTSIDGTDITGATIDGTDVQEITVDGDTVFSAIQVIDDFNDTDFSEYSGDTGNLSQSTTTVKEGSGSAEFFQPSGSNIEVTSTSGLENYPEAGDTFRYFVRQDVDTDSSRVSHQFGVQGTDSYSIDFRPNSNEIRFSSTYDSGNNLTINTTLNANEWYEIEVDWGTNGTFTIDAFDDTGSRLNNFPGTTTDNNQTTGGIGIVNKSPFGFSSFTDDWRII